MRRTISSLMVLGVIGGCSGGGGGGMMAPADTQAPSVSVVGPATIEGGQTVALSVTVTDNVSTGLTPTLSCTGNGTLTGTMLATTAVTVNTTVTCTATATDAAGNVGRGTLTIVVQPSTASATLSAGSQQVRAGGFGLIYATNLTLDQASYQGTLNGAPVRLDRLNGSELVFGVPVGTAAGAQRLIVQIGGRSFSFDVTVNAAIAVANPREAVRTALNGAKTSIADLLANNSNLTSDLRTTLQSQQGKLDSALALLDSASDSDVAGIASFFAANGLISSGAGTTAAAYLPVDVTVGAECGTRFREFSRNVAGTIFFAAVLAKSVDAAIALAVFVPPSAFVTAVLAGAGIGIAAPLVIEYGRKIRPSYRSAFTACWTETSFEFLPLDVFTQQSAKGWVAPQAVAAKQGFRNNVSRSFRLSRSFAPQAAIAAEATRAISDISATLSTISVFSDDIRATVEDLRLTATEFVPASRIGLTGISGGTVLGSLSGSGDTIMLNFRVPNPPVGQTNIDFNFTLTRAEGEESLSVPAQLTFMQPEADDAAVEVTQGQAINSMVQARGADVLEIVTQPTNGTVSLQTSGMFRYTPSGQYFGADQFTYRARNADGVSRTATVAIAVVRRFEGVWNITARSTTTSQSSAGLCPNEVNTFSINIAKVSDTQYTTSYQGFPLTLTQTSRDDPAGLIGSTTVTYADDPGQTTESINARVPNSTQITGSGSFSYSGPNNTRCSGTTSITGVRP